MDSRDDLGNVGQICAVRDRLPELLVEKPPGEQAGRRDKSGKEPYEEASARRKNLASIARPSLWLNSCCWSPIFYLLVAVFWTIMSGVEYFVGALPLFRPERLARPLEKGHV